MLLIISYCTVVVTYLISTINNIELPISIDYFLLINICFFGYYFLKHKIKIFHNRKANLILVLMLILFVFYQLFNIDTHYISETLQYSAKNFLAIINIYMVSIYMYYNKSEQRIIIATYFMISIFVVIMYLNNFDNFDGLKAILNTFDKDLRYRNSFGLFHENELGNLCYISLILSFYILKNIRSDTFILKHSVYLVSLGVFFVLISTSSRTAITSLVLFFVVFYIRQAKNKTNENKPYMKKYISNIVRVVCITLGMEICIVALVNFIYKVKDTGISDFIAQTNRQANFDINIPILYKNSLELMGVGFFKALSELYGGTTYLDNWYLYMFVTSGYIGLIISIILLCIVSFSILRKSSYTLLEEITIAFFLTQLYYNMFESFLFNATFLNSFVLWIFIFITILYKYQGNNDNKMICS